MICQSLTERTYAGETSDDFRLRRNDGHPDKSVQEASVQCVARAHSQTQIDEILPGSALPDILDRRRTRARRYPYKTAESCILADFDRAVSEPEMPISCIYCIS